MESNSELIHLFLNQNRQSWDIIILHLLTSRLKTVHLQIFVKFSMTKLMGAISQN